MVGVWLAALQCKLWLADERLRACISVQDGVTEAEGGCRAGGGCLGASVMEGMKGLGLGKRLVPVHVITSATCSTFTACTNHHMQAQAHMQTLTCRANRGLYLVMQLQLQCLMTGIEQCQQHSTAQHSMPRRAGWGKAGSAQYSRSSSGGIA